KGLETWWPVAQQRHQSRRSAVSVTGGQALSGKLHGSAGPDVACWPLAWVSPPASFRLACHLPTPRTRSRRGQQLHDQGDAAEAQSIVVVQLALLALGELLLVDEGPVARAGVLHERLAGGGVALDDRMPGRGAGVLQLDVGGVVDAGAPERGAPA